MIRHKICSILTLACLFLPVLPAQAAPSLVQGTVDKLNIRTGPGLTYNVVKQLPTNTKLSVVQEQDDWYQVTLPDGTSGWTASWLVKPLSGTGQTGTTSTNKGNTSTGKIANNTPTQSVQVSTVPSVTSVSVSTATSTASSGAVIQSTVNNLNVRSGPGQTFQVVQSINQNKSYPILTKSGQWVQIRLSASQTGWVASWLVKESSGTQTSVPTTNSSVPPATTSKTKTLAADSQVYFSPDFSSMPIGLISKGDTITIEQEQAGWLRVNYDGQPGWIQTVSGSPSPNNSGNTPPARQVPQAPASQVKVNATNVNVRSQPNTSSTIIGKVSQNDLLPVILTQGEWVQVRLSNQQTGWIAGWLVDQVTASTPDITQTPGSPDTPATPDATTQSTATILNPDTNLRSGPGTTYEIVGRVQAGERYPILSTEGEWFRLQLTDGSTGYVAGWLVSAEGTSNVIHGDQLKNKLIVVDAGHGGNDTGAMGSNFSTQEKVINLQVALDLKAKLEAAGAKVIMTRSDDRTLTLKQRVETAVTNKADLFVSVHHNTHSNTAMNGSIIFYYKEGNSSKLASMVQTEISKSTGYIDLHSRFGDYYVLRENPIVSILCEVGFMSNYEEELRIRSSNQQNLAADGIYKGIARYFQSQDQ